MITRDPLSSQKKTDATGKPATTDQPASDTQLYEKLKELTGFIDKTITTITRFSTPMSATAEQLPAAAAHLKEVRKMTEEGTHKVMQLVEAIETNRKQAHIQFDALVHSLASSDAASNAAKIEAIRKTLGRDEKPLVDIVTALAFQDLVAQRVNKLVTIIDVIEEKLKELVVIFGPYTKGAGKAEMSRAADMLKQLEASHSTAIDQNLADEILKQYGFN